MSKLPDFSKYLRSNYLVLLECSNIGLSRHLDMIYPFIWGDRVDPDGQTFLHTLCKDIFISIDKHTLAAGWSLLSRAGPLYMECVYN